MSNQAVDPVSQRLEDLRLRCGLSLAAFHRRVTAAGSGVSYPTVKNYHHDRTPPLHYLQHVGLAFDVDPRTLAFGPKPGGTALDDSGRGIVVDADPSDPVHHHEEVEFIGFRSKFYAHLHSPKPVHDSLMRLLDDFWERLPRAWDQDGPIHPRDQHDALEAHQLTMEWLHSLDDMLSGAWDCRNQMLDARHPGRAPDTLDQRLRFMRGVEEAVLSSLPDRGRPDLPPPTTTGGSDA